MHTIERGTRQGFVSALTELELLVRPLRQNDVEEMERIAALLGGHSLAVVDLDRSVARTAAAIRAEHRLALADATVVATAIVTRCDVLVGNDERCAQRVREVSYVLLDDLVKEQST